MGMSIISIHNRLPKLHDYQCSIYQAPSVPDVIQSLCTALYLDELKDLLENSQVRQFAWFTRQGCLSALFMAPTRISLA